MNFYITIVVFLLAFLNIVKACNTPIYAQRGPRGPPGMIGVPGTSIPSQIITVSVMSRRKRQSPILPQAILKFPLETEEISEANIIARKTINNLIQKIENKDELTQKNQFRPYYTFEDNKLMAQIYINLNDAKECESFIKVLMESKDDKTSVECV